MSTNILVYLAMATTVILWSSAFIGIRLGIQAYSPECLALSRFLLASAVLLLIYIRLPDKHPIRLKDIPRFILSGIFGYLLYHVSLNYSEITVSASVASFFIGLSPVITAVLAMVFIHEKVSKRSWLGFAISLIGMTLLTWGEEEFGHFDRGIVFVLIAAVSVSLFAILNKSMLKKYHPIELTAFSIWSATLMLSFYIPGLPNAWASAPWQVNAWVIYMGIFPTAIAYLTWFYALQKLSASGTMTVLYLTPAVTTLLAWLLINEWPSAISLVGGLIAMLGGLLVKKKSEQRNKSVQVTSGVVDGKR